MPASSRGFTLIEVLTAIAIASLILLAVTSTIFTLNRAYSRTSERMEQQRALRNTIDLLRREISSTLYRPEDKALRFQVLDRDFYGKPASSLKLATIAPSQDGEVSDQIVVQYRPEQQGDRILLARSSRDYFQNETDRPDSYPLLERLEGFLVECHDGSRWLKTWDSDLVKGLPKQVRITVTVPDGNRQVSFRLLATPKADAR